MTDIGYARVCTREQNPALQHDALAKADRPRLAGALAYLRPGDILVVWQLDRLGRNMRHLTFLLFASLAEFEGDLLRERTAVGLTAIAGRRTRVRIGGRPRKMTLEKVAVVRQMYASQSFTVAQIAKSLGVARGTVYTHLDQSAAA